MFFKFILLVGLPAFCLCKADITGLKPYDFTSLSLFRSDDTDNNGELTPAEAKHAFLRYDSNNDTKVSRHEFAEALDNEYNNATLSQDTLYTIFNILDSDDDQHLTQPDFDAFFAVLDTDDNGGVTSSEYITYWVKTFEVLEQLENL